MKRYAVLFGMLAVAALATSAGAQIPEPSGSYALSEHGSFAICINPLTGAEESCSANNALDYPLTYLATGTTTWASGIACENDYEVITSLPPTITLPTVVLNAHTVVKVTSYDAATGTGTASTIGYAGGSCNGANFDSSGATETSTGAVQFVLSEGGRHNDILATQLTNSTNSIGGFSVSATELKQTLKWSK